MSATLGTVKPFTVLVEGNIGSGKTSLLKHFAVFDDVNVLIEPVKQWRDVNGHNLLQLMYNDSERWGLMFQSYGQLTMMQNHLGTSYRPIKLMERSIFSNHYCFAENFRKSGKMSMPEFEVLSQWFLFLTTSPLLDFKVDLIIYLRTRPEIAMGRLLDRARGEETNVSLSYLQELHCLHDDWLIENRFPLPAPVVIIDADRDMEGMMSEYTKYESIILNRPMI